MPKFVLAFVNFLRLAFRPVTVVVNSFSTPNVTPPLETFRVMVAAAASMDRKRERAKLTRVLVDIP